MITRTQLEDIKDRLAKLDQRLAAALAKYKRSISPKSTKEVETTSNKD